MSKLINVPGTTSFIPLDDVISIKIQGKLSVEEKLVFPETSEDLFRIAISPTVKFYLVTSYVRDSNEELEEGSEETDKSDEIATILWSETELEEANGTEIELVESNQYTSMDEKGQAQTKLRLKKFTDNLERVQAKSDLLLKIRNINSEVDPENTSLAESELEEEENITPMFSSSTLQAAFDPDQSKLKELEDYLENDSDAQEKRITWLIKHYQRSTIELEHEDSYVFLNELENRGITKVQIEHLKDDVRRAIDEVATLVG